MKKTVAEIITEQIIERLENGEIPWRKPWTPLTGPNAPKKPHNW